jgi:hypothetical protein
MMVGRALIKQQRTPRHADAATNIFSEQLNGALVLTSKVILPDEDWQQKERVYLKVFCVSISIALQISSTLL